MIIFVELMSERKEWDDKNMLDKTDDIKDEYDYHTKHKPLENKVLKFEFYLYTKINGVF
jgi:hypothetical protein